MSHMPNPLYATALFHVTALPARWPAEFVIVTAYAPTGQKWSDDKNIAADQHLEAELRSLDVWRLRITGYSPDTGHAEPGWAIELSLGVGRKIGRKFGQDAIFVVRADALGYARCKEEGDVTWFGTFRQRVSVAPPSHPEC